MTDIHALPDMHYKYMYNEPQIERPTVYKTVQLFAVCTIPFAQCFDAQKS